MRRVQPSPTDWAYLAGLMDGEGCIRTVHHRETFHAAAKLARRIKELKHAPA